MPSLRLLTLLLPAALSCGQPTPAARSQPSTYAAQLGAGAAAPAPSASDYPVGTSRLVLDVNPQRRVPVQLWYPAAESARAQAAAGRSVVDFEPPGPEREQWARLNAQAGPQYTQKIMHAADAPPLAAEITQLPLVLISHCSECLRTGYFVIAERLAAHGFLVAAPDHVNGTLYDLDQGTSVGLDMDDFLEQRRLDIAALTDTLLDPNAKALPPDLRGHVDPERIGMLGHSFGAITTAYASTTDPRIRAIAILMMIVSQDDRLPYTGDQLAKRIMRQPLSKPAFFVMGTEDVIALFGMNDTLRSNFEHYPTAAWLATIKDAGHYSVTNLCGINIAYNNGCGPGQRVDDLLERFTYLNIDLATDLTAQLVTTYFELQLLGAARTGFADIVSHHASVLTLAQHTP